MNQNKPKPNQQVEVKPEEIAAAFTVGLVIVGVIYLLWKAGTSSNAAAISSEAASAVTKSTMSAVDIASMLNH